MSIAELFTPTGSKLTLAAAQARQGKLQALVAHGLLASDRADTLAEFAVPGLETKFRKPREFYEMEASIARAEAARHLPELWSLTLRIEALTTTSDEEPLFRVLSPEAQRAIRETEGIKSVALFPGLGIRAAAYMPN